MEAARGERLPSAGGVLSDAAFNARAVYWLRPDRLYRVYPRRGEIFFVRIGGQGTEWSAALGVVLGPLGGLISERLARRRREKLQRRVEEVDRLPPEFRVREHRHSFQLGLGQVQGARIRQAARIGAHGHHVGRWLLELHSGEQWSFQFESAEDLSAAIDLLSGELGDLLQIETESSPTAPE